VDRTKGIGGTDIGAIVGMSRFKSKFDVWLEKTGQAAPKEITLPMKLGSRMEPLLSELYTEETGIVPDILDPPIIFMPDKPWHCGSPDRTVAVQGKMRVLELKTAGDRMSYQWGEPGTDEIPKDYYLQTMWYMPLLKTDEAEVAALIGNRKFAIYKITLDLEILAFLEEEAEKFWVDHVLANKAPEIEATDGAKNWLRKMYPQDQGAILEPTDEEILDTLRRYSHARKQLKEWENEADNLEVIIKNIIGSNAGLEGPWGRITWKRAKDSISVDWRNLAMSFLPSPDQMERFTTIKSGSRRFLPKFREE
jgi:putative phage-type endonuclease